MSTVEGYAKLPIVILIHPADLRLPKIVDLENEGFCINLIGW